ncbi:serine hydrolase domain-containing protein [Enterococcus songbeiensis]|uniref:serine hydrolase domain-containing protein n=1 Tax=Enterococcus songbeiensis TaxID=2559927 RepID=UPI0010F4F064|nr:serine hydrolase [Enterococcus songbeiensis]
MYPATQKIIQKKMQQGVYPGVIYELIHGKNKEMGIYGAAAILPEFQGMEESLLFDVASLTKVVCTTTVVLKLWEQGKLMIDQSLHTYLPEFLNREITLRHLLTHTADIQTWIPNRDQLNKEALRQAYLKMENGENIGKVVNYTDAGTILLGFMLEKLFQKPVIEIFQEEVLTPLKMTASCFLPSDKKKIVPTQQQADGTVLRGITHDPKARILAEHAGNAGLFTNLADLEKFVQMYLDWGMIAGQSFLRKKTIIQLLKDQTPDGKGGRSFGWDLKIASKQSALFHTGYTGTFLLIDPQRQEACIFLSNRIHPNDDRAGYIKHRDEILAVYQKERFLE